MTRFSFDTQAATRAAWDFIWREKLKARKAMKKDGFRYHETFYTTASDLVAQVRKFAAETIEGKKWGSTGLAFGRSESWAGGKRFKLRFDLGDARSWLRHQGNIVSHNFGRGHISGERYRPAGQPLSEVEKATLAKKDERERNPRPRLEHYSKSFGGNPLCTAERRKGRWSFRQSKAWTTNVREEVTCKACQNLLAKLPVEAPKCEPVEA